MKMLREDGEGERGSGGEGEEGQPKRASDSHRQTDMEPYSYTVTQIDRKTAQLSLFSLIQDSRDPDSSSPHSAFPLRLSTLPSVGE